MHAQGLGEQYTAWPLNGRVVPVVSTEQGVGRGLKPITAILNSALGGAGGNWHDTYSAVPHYVSSEGTGLFVNSTAYSEFDFSVPESVTVSVVGEAGRVEATQFCLSSAASVLALVEEYTAGRCRPAQRAPTLVCAPS